METRADRLSAFRRIDVRFTLYEMRLPYVAFTRVQDLLVLSDVTIDKPSRCLRHISSEKT